jgi:hypothetical protein
VDRPHEQNFGLGAHLTPSLGDTTRRPLQGPVEEESIVLETWRHSESLHARKAIEYPTLVLEDIELSPLSRRRSSRQDPFAKAHSEYVVYGMNIKY